MWASQGLYFMLFKQNIFRIWSIIHIHACRVKPERECLSVEPEKVGAFSCRKSDFIPVSTQTPSITEHRARVIHYLPSRIFYPGDLTMILKVRWQSGKKWFYLLTQTSFRSLLASKTTWSKVCNSTPHIISRHTDLLVNQLLQSSETIDHFV